VPLDENHSRTDPRHIGVAQCGKRIRCREPHQPQPPTRNPVSLDENHSRTDPRHIDVAHSSCSFQLASWHWQLNVNEWIRITRRALFIRGHWQVRFGLVWLAVCQPECPSHWPLGRGPGPGPAAASSSKFSGCSSAAEAPISSAINCDGTRGPALLQVPPGH